jgi:hypothetical protein
MTSALAPSAVFIINFSNQSSQARDAAEGRRDQGVVAAAARGKGLPNIAALLSRLRVANGARLMRDLVGENASSASRPLNGGDFTCCAVC